MIFHRHVSLPEGNPNFHFTKKSGAEELKKTTSRKTIFQTNSVGKQISGQANRGD